MATKSTPTDKGNASPNSAPVYEAFPEPRAWAQQWDGSALYTVTKPQAKPNNNYTR